MPGRRRTISKALTKEHVRKHYSSGAVAYYESGAPVRMMTPEESAYAAQRFDEWLAEVERAAAARALEEAADGIESRRNEPGLVHLDVRYAGYYTGIRSGMESDSKALRARAAEIRERGGS